MTNNKNIPTSCPQCEHKISGNSLFCCLNIDEINEVSDSKRNMLFKKGQTIFNEGNHPHGIYCIHKGKVKIHKLGEEGKDQIVRLAKDNNFIGYRAILGGDTYMASATAIEDTQVCFIPKEAITNLIKSNSSFSFSLLGLLSDDLKRAENKITNMAQKHVRERIAEAILLLKEAYGFKEDGVSIDSSLTRKELANIAGTTTETSIRILSEFQKDKMVELDGKNIKITNLNSLIKTANIFD
ncbi:MAG: Crp/Fnr family transcriptional regulator [Vicingus serpentipes]|nr:Crp/Fnr family transcriptional regulator [Vicingus serpentipes]